MRKIRKGDTVAVVTGKDKGRSGVVLKVLFPKKLSKGVRLLVEGVNLVKKHVKPNPAQEKPGGIVERESSIHVSNVAILNTTTNKADRVTFKTLEDGRKVRVFKSTNEEIDV